MACTQSARPGRVYVKVNSDFDRIGYMMPRSITWTDGRVFKIDEVRDFRPAYSIAHGLLAGCYTVIINGRKRHLFFERTEPRFAAQLGRWFVESDARS